MWLAILLYDYTCEKAKCFLVNESELFILKSNAVDPLK